MEGGWLKKSRSINNFLFFLFLFLFFYFIKLFYKNKIILFYKFIFFIFRFQIEDRVIFNYPPSTLHLFNTIIYIIKSNLKDYLYI
jgi:hypothetical protein